MAIKEGDHLLDDGDTTLSSSELDDVLSSAEFQDMDAQDSSLEQYGVWVKVKPEDLEAQEEGADAFGLSDLDTGVDTALTAEEEELLGELEDEPMEAGEFEGLEADLEALGRTEEPGGEDVELSMDDLDVDLQDLDLEDTGGEESGGESFAESMEDLAGDQEIDLPLSEDAVVEEHFAGMTSMGVGATAAAASTASADILEQIEADLKQIKSEIQTLKRELTSMGRVGATGQVEVQPMPEGPPGFFNQDEDETIALTGDELDNILNTADITEETAEPVVEEPEDELPALEEGAEVLDLEAEPSPGDEDQILELGSLDLDEEEPAGAPAEIDIPMGGEQEPQLAQEVEPLLEEAGEAEEPLDLDLEELTAEEEEVSLEETPLEETPLGETPLEEVEEPEELILEDLGEAPGDEEEILLEAVEEEPEGEGLTLEADTAEGGAEMEELELEELEIPAEGEGTELGESLEEFDLGEEDLEAVDLEELGPAEAGEELSALSSLSETEAQAPEPGGEEEEILELEPLAEVGEEAPEEELSAEESPLEEFPLEELSLEESSLEELSLEESSLEESSPEEPDLEESDLEELGADEQETLEPLELPGEGEEPGDLSSGRQSVEPSGTVGSMSPELKKDVTSVLSYLDQLLEALPEDKIREFAHSEYFETYKRLFDELGLGA
ncbi:MAG: hypothetical protein JW820_06505 [Spirochaetales bacterium]|nr:hypothetical protein [Spirochaetales bacterium]